MGCILFTVTEDSFGSLKSWVRLRWLAMKASRRPQQAGTGRLACGPVALCKLRGRGLGCRTSVASNERAEKPSSEKHTARHSPCTRASSLCPPPRPPARGSNRLAEGPLAAGRPAGASVVGRLWERHLHAKCLPPILVLAFLVSISFRQRLRDTVL